MNKVKLVYDFIIASKLRSSILIGLICIATFGNTLFNDYNLDDNLVTQNHRLTSKGIKAIPEIYRSPYYQDDMGYSYGYRPTTLATFAIEHDLFGESPMINHSVNLLLYLITCILIFLLIVKIFPDQAGVALATAILFTVHPIHTEVVASIKNRDELLSLLFMLIAMKSFLMTKEKVKWTQTATLAFSGICFVGLSLSSKLSAAILILLIPFLISESVKPMIRLGIYGIINYILVEIFHARTGFYPWYFLAPFITMLMIDVWKSISWPKLVLKTRNLFFRFAQFAEQISMWFSERPCSYLLKLKSYLSDALYRSSKLLKNSFEIQNLRKVYLNVFNLLKAIPDSVKIPVALSFLILFNNQQFISVTLIGVFFLLANRIQIRYRTLLTHFAILTILATSGVVVIVPIIFPLLFFSRYFSRTKQQSSIAIDIIYLAGSLVLVYADVFIVKPTDGQFYTNAVIFTFYSFSVFTSWFLARLAKLSGISFLFAQGSIAIISCAALVNFFNINSDELIAPLLFNLIILFQILIQFLARKYEARFIRKVNFLFPSIRYAAASFLLVVLIFNLKNYAVINKELFVMNLENIFFETSSVIENEKLQLINWIKEYSLINEIERTQLSESAQLFYANTLDPLSKSVIPFEFDSAYIFQATHIIKEQQQLSAGRPFDFIENPIPVSSNKFLRYGFYLSTISRYLVNFCCPHELGYYYGYNEVWISNFLEPSSIFILITLILLGISVVVLMRKNELLIGFSLIIMIACLLPFSGAIEPLPGTYSPRFGYVSSFFFCSFAVGITSKIFFEQAKKPLIISGLIICTTILLIFIGDSINRNQLWKNKLTLMQHDIKNVSNSAQAHNLLAHAIMEDVFKDNRLSDSELKNVKEAKLHFTKATEIYPFFFNAWVDLGKVNRMLNDNSGSVQAWQTALTIDSTYSPIVLQLAQTFESMGDYEQAVNYYRSYLRANPTTFEAYDNLARMLYLLGRYQESIKICEGYLKIDPNQSEFLNNIQNMRAALEAQKNPKTAPQ